ncbi:hypothetical protein EV188_101781 [Actinomycetospora succinea]|uniref:Trypsin-co-occurring domain-containing protein n=1 Tax=Actinomycetospora succinea TaxID=663603 RepID=A0A4R6VNS5_9PSEU|nr:CU044_2847 family protein [Actinomycetospora succinea]TDQ65529.1 hypothetical protein EV188_101781 [Actinomycetospora succinea]
MSDFVRFELTDGSEVLFETASSDLVQQYAGAATTTDGGALGQRLAGAAETAETVARTLRSRLTPSELSLELGLKVSGEANWFFAKNQAEGTIKVTLKWAAPPTPGAAVPPVEEDAPAPRNPAPDAEPPS